MTVEPRTIEAIRLALKHGDHRRLTELLDLRTVAPEDDATLLALLAGI